jgi:RHS repeat-associated protein
LKLSLGLENFLFHKLKMTVEMRASTIAQAYYIHADQLDTPRQITDTNGAVVWQWDNLDPFGNNMANENPNGAGQFSFNLRFPGQYFDRETSLNYNINRDYDPAIGRYIQSDPIGLRGGVNTYTYVEGNPLSYVDPLGLDKTIWTPGPGRTIFDGPRNGYWGGGKWSGGVSGGGTGNASALDSGDECYQRHDQCFDSGTSKASCNRKLVDELKALPDDSKKWPRPPASGTEKDSERYRQGAITIFGR